MRDFSGDPEGTIANVNKSRVDMKTQDLDAKDIKAWPMQKGTVYEELK